VHVLRPDALRSYAAAGRKSEACASLHRAAGSLVSRRVVARAGKSPRWQRIVAAGKLRPFSPEGRRTG
jgi:hypothetical protein